VKIIPSLIIFKIIGATCIFLAGKVEETPKKLKDVLEVTYKIRHKDKELAADSPVSLMNDSK
jgi:hypothetical protein